MWILLLLYWKKVSCKTSYKNHISIFFYLVSNSEGFLWSISLKDRVLSRQYAIIDTVDPGFNKHDLYRILRYIEQNLSVPLFLTTKSLIQNLGLTNTPFNEFLIISNVYWFLDQTLLCIYRIYLQLLYYWNLSDFRCMQ